MVNVVRNAGAVNLSAGRTAGVSRTPVFRGGVRLPVGGCGKQDDLEKNPPVTEELMDYIRGKMQEIYAKIKSGDTEKSYAIGSASYTEREWERLIEEFDTAEEAIQEEIAEEILSAEKVRTEYPPEKPGEKGRCTITFITSTGIYCKKEGSEEFRWKIEFEDISQYDQVMSVLNRFDTEDNLRFADSRYFWEDVLSGSLDVEDFVDFWNQHAKDDNANYAVLTEDGVRIDPEAVKYTKYMPPDYVGEIFFSLEDLLAFENEKFQKVYREWEKDPKMWVKKFNRENPKLAGLRNWCFYGNWYTAEELDELFSERKASEAFASMQGADRKTTRF